MKFNLTDDSPMPFGKYRSVPMREVPASYLHWLWTQPGFQTEREPKKEAVCAYIRENHKTLEIEYPDGIWTTESERKVEGDITQNRRDKRATRQHATCKHFNKICEGVCRAGVPYSKFAVPLPCLPSLVPSIEQRPERCAKFAAPTREEIERENADFAAHSQKINVARAAIVADANGGHGNGVIKCPVCSGRLRYSIAPCNGHVHASCSNPDCVRWTE